MLSTIALFSVASFSAAQKYATVSTTSACTAIDLQAYQPASISQLMSCLEYGGQLAETSGTNGGLIGADWQPLCKISACKAVVDLDIASPTCYIERQTATLVQRIPIIRFFEEFASECTHPPTPAPTQAVVSTVTEATAGPENYGPPAKATETSGTAYMVPAILTLAFPFYLLC